MQVALRGRFAHMQRAMSVILVFLVASLASSSSPVLAEEAGTQEAVVAPETGDREDVEDPSQVNSGGADLEESSSEDEDEGAVAQDSSLDALLAAGWLDASGQPAVHRLMESKDAEDGPLLLLFRRESCRRSWRLERALLEDLRLRLVSQSLVRAVVEEGSPAGGALAKSLRVLTVPTILVLSSDMRELARVEGGEDKDLLFSRLRAVTQGSGSIDQLERAASQRPFDIHLAFELGEWHALRGDSVAAKRHFARIFVLRRMLAQSPRALVRGAADVGRLGDSADFGPIRSALEMDLAGVNEEVDTLLASAYFALAEYVYLRDREDPQLALEIFEDLRRRFPDSPEARRSTLSMAVAHNRLGSPRRALLELTRHRFANAEDPEALTFAFLSCVGEGEMAVWAATTVKQEIEARYPLHAGLHHASALLQEGQGDVEEALFSARRAAELQPEWGWHDKEVARLEALQPPAEEEEPEQEEEETFFEQEEPAGQN